jgi:hypothetical protein
MAVSNERLLELISRQETMLVILGDREPDLKKEYMDIISLFEELRDYRWRDPCVREKWKCTCGAGDKALVSTHAMNCLLGSS